MSVKSEDRAMAALSSVMLVRYRPSRTTLSSRSLCLSRARVVTVRLGFLMTSLVGLQLGPSSESDSSGARSLEMGGSSAADSAGLRVCDEVLGLSFRLFLKGGWTEGWVFSGGGSGVGSGVGKMGCVGEVDSEVSAAPSAGLGLFCLGPKRFLFTIFGFFFSLSRGLLEGGMNPDTRSEAGDPAVCTFRIWSIVRT